MDIDGKLVDYVVELSRIRLDDGEKKRLSGQLSRIIKYVEKLKELDTDGVEPLAHPLEVVNVFRNDEERPSLSRDQALANAPDRTGDFFTVPAVID